MIEIVVNGQRIIAFNGSCIVCEDGKLKDINLPDNLAIGSEIDNDVEDIKDEELKLEE